MIINPLESHYFVVSTVRFIFCPGNLHNPLALIQSSFHWYSNPFALWGFVEVTVCSRTHSDNLLVYDIKGFVSHAIHEWFTILCFSLWKCVFSAWLSWWFCFLLLLLLLLPSHASLRAISRIRTIQQIPNKFLNTKRKQYVILFNKNS